MGHRAFHIAHHQHTGDPDRDAELASPKPAAWRSLAWDLATFVHWRNTARFPWRNASGRARAGSKQAPHRQIGRALGRRRLVREGLLTMPIRNTLRLDKVLLNGLFFDENSANATNSCWENPMSTTARDTMHIVME